MKCESFVAIRYLTLLVFVLDVLAAGSASVAQEKRLLNIDKDGVAVHGYDPVAYFAKGKAIKGDPQYKSSYAGAIYYLSRMLTRKPLIKNLPSTFPSTEVTVRWQ